VAAASAVSANAPAGTIAANAAVVALGTNTPPPAVVTVGASSPAATSATATLVTPSAPRLARADTLTVFYTGTGVLRADEEAQAAVDQPGEDDSAASDMWLLDAGNSASAPDAPPEESAGEAGE
jgi:hypothetical protein